MDTDSSNNILHAMRKNHQKSMLLISAAVDFLITLARKIKLLNALLYSATQTALALLITSSPIKTQRKSIARHFLATICVIIKRIEFNEMHIKSIKSISISVAQDFSTLIHEAKFKKHNSHAPQHN